MLLLIGNLVETLVTCLNGADKGLFTSMNSKVIKEPLWLFKELSTSSVITRVHCGLSLSVGIWVSYEFELSEEAGAGNRKLFFEV